MASRHATTARKAAAARGEECNAFAAGLRHLDEVAQLPSFTTRVQRVNLHGNNLTSLSCGPAFPTLAFLTHLDVSSNPLGLGRRDSILDLGPITARLPSLTHLDLSACQIAGITWSPAPQFSSAAPAGNHIRGQAAAGSVFPCLQTLRLPYNSINCVGLRGLIHHCPPSLTSLDLRGNPLDVEALDDSGGRCTLATCTCDLVARLPALRSLNLGLPSSPTQLHAKVLHILRQAPSLQTVDGIDFPAALHRPEGDGQAMPSSPFRAATPPPPPPPLPPGGGPLLPSSMSMQTAAHTDALVASSPLHTPTWPRVNLPGPAPPFLPRVDAAAARLRERLLQESRRRPKPGSPPQESVFMSLGHNLASLSIDVVEAQSPPGDSGKHGLAGAGTDDMTQMEPDRTHPAVSAESVASGATVSTSLVSVAVQTVQAPLRACGMQTVPLVNEPASTQTIRPAFSHTSSQTAPTPRLSSQLVQTDMQMVDASVVEKLQQQLADAQGRLQIRSNRLEQQERDLEALRDERDAAWQELGECKRREHACAQRARKVRMSVLRSFVYARADTLPSSLNYSKPQAHR